MIFEIYYSYPGTLFFAIKGNKYGYWLIGHLSG